MKAAEVRTNVPMLCSALQTVDTLYIIDSSEEDDYVLEEMYAGLLVMMESWEIAAARGSREERGRLLMLVQDQLNKIGVTPAPVQNLTAAQVTALAGRNIAQAAGAQQAPVQQQGYNPGPSSSASAQGYIPGLAGPSSMAAAPVQQQGYSMGLPTNMLQQGFNMGAQAGPSSMGQGYSSGANSMALMGYNTPQPTLSAPGMQFIPSGPTAAAFGGGFALMYPQPPTDPRRRYMVEGGRGSEVQWAAASTAAPAAAAPRPPPAAPAHG